MNPEPTIRVLIADDHPIVRQGLAAMIGRRPDMAVVGEAVNGKQAIEIFREQRPDITLMDLRMPEMDGVAAIAVICREFPEARIIVLTTYDGDEDIYQGLHAGAKGYLLKDAQPESLLETIRVVYAGKTHLAPDVAAKLVERLSGPHLTAREIEVLHLMTLGRNNPQIAAELSIAESTVKTHLNNILVKLGAGDRTQAVTIGLKRGIVRLG